MLFSAVFGDLPLITYTSRVIKMQITGENVNIWVKKNAEDVKISDSEVL